MRNVHFRGAALGDKNSLNLAGARSRENPPNFQWKVGSPLTAENTLVVFDEAALGQVTEIAAERKAIVLVEPSYYRPHAYTQALDLMQAGQVHAIFAGEQDFVYFCERRKLPAHYLPIGGSRIPLSIQRNYIGKPKQYFCSLILSAKDELPGHQLRRKLARIIKDDPVLRDAVHVYDPLNGYVDKIMATANYAYQIVIENGLVAGRIDDKLIDPLSVDTRVLYWGDPLDSLVRVRADDLFARYGGERNSLVVVDNIYEYPDLLRGLLAAWKPMSVPSEKTQAVIDRNRTIASGYQIFEENMFSEHPELFFREGELPQ